MYGKAGRYTAGATDRDMVHTINFVILDRSTQQVRTVGVSKRLGSHVVSTFADLVLALWY